MVGWWNQSCNYNSQIQVLSGQHCGVALSSYLHPCVSVTKQYNFVPVNGRCSEAGKVTIGLVTQWQCVTDFVVYPRTGCRPMRGKWAPLKVHYDTFVHQLAAEDCGAEIAAYRAHDDDDDGDVQWFIKSWLEAGLAQHTAKFQWSDAYSTQTGDDWEGWAAYKRSWIVWVRMSVPGRCQCLKCSGIVRAAEDDARPCVVHELYVLNVTFLHQHFIHKQINNMSTNSNMPTPILLRDCCNYYNNCNCGYYFDYHHHYRHRHHHHHYYHYQQEA